MMLGYSHKSSMKHSNLEILLGTTKAKVLSQCFHLLYTKHLHGKRWLQRFTKTPPSYLKLFGEFNHKNFENLHGITKAKEISRVSMYIAPTSPWKTATTKFAWVTPFCHKKRFKTKHDISFCKHRYPKAQREGICTAKKNTLMLNWNLCGWPLVKTEPCYLARKEQIKKG